MARGIIAGIAVAAVAAVLILAGGIYVYFYRKKKKDTKLLSAYEDQSSHDGQGMLRIRFAPSPVLVIM